MRRTFLFHQGMPTRNLSLVILVPGALLLLLWLPCLWAAAPVTPSGLHTQVSDPIIIGPMTQYDITGGTRPGGASGTNLFHSFGDFNVPTNNIANFLNAGSIDLAGHQLPAGLQTVNILARVTGGNLSNIYGTIQTTDFGNANLFLMNPAGFLFGPNATVNVGGMMTFTTADYLKLADGVSFNKTPNVAQDALLSAMPVAAFGFLGSNPGAIAVQGSQFTVIEGTGISLVGGDITVQSGTLEDGTVQPAKLSAPDGQINLVSVGSPGEILARTLGQVPNITGQSFGTLGTIQVLEQSVIDASGTGGGTVLIRGGRFVLDNSTISANITGPGIVTDGFESIGRGIDIVVSQDAMIQNGAILETTVSGNGSPGVQYGGVSVKADRIEILGSQDVENPNPPVTGIFSNVGLGSTGGSSGDIKLEANSILVREFGTFTTFLGTETNGAGNAGNILMKASGNLEMDGGVSVDTLSGSSASGNAGNIEFTSTAGNILLTNSPFVDSQSGAFSSGSVGSIAVNAPNGDILLAGNPIIGPAVVFTHIGGTGPNAGKGGIQLTAKNLTIENSGIQIDNFTPFQPGGLTVNLTGTLSLSGTDSPSTLLTTTRGLARSADLNITAHDIFLADGSRVSTETYRSGNGGTLNIFTQHLELTNGAQIRSSSIFNPFPPPGPPETPSGAGGIITIQGLTSPDQSVLIDGAGSGIFTDTQGTGAGGNIFVNANSVTLQNSGTLSAKTTGTGDAGNILVEANSVSITGGAQLTSSSVQRLARFEGEGVPLPTGNAGNITIRGIQGPTSPAQSVLISGFFDENFNPTGGIFTEIQGAGAGGTIDISANQVQLTDVASLSARTSGSGNAGNITIHASQFASDTSFIKAETTGVGNAGNISIVTAPVPGAMADEIRITSSEITTKTEGDGRAGAILLQTTGNLSVSNSLIESSAEPNVAQGFTGGRAGTIQLSAGQDISLTDSVLTVKTGGNKSGGEIFLSGNNLYVEGTSLNSLSVPAPGLQGGDAGDIRVEINGTTRFVGSSVRTETHGNGNGGNISLTTGVSSLEDSYFSSDTSPIRGDLTGGIGGNILLKTDHMTVSGNSLISSRSDNSVGRAGNVTVIATGSVELLGSGTHSDTITTSSNGVAPSCALKCGDAGILSISAHALTLDRAGLASSTTGDGNAGSLELAVGTLTVRNGSQLSARTIGSGAGGSISINSTDSVAVSNSGEVVGHSRPSGIFTDTQGTGSGGSIFVNANAVTLQNGGTLSAATSGNAPSATGGTIAVDATNTVTMTTGATITANSNGAANAGNINITATNGLSMQNSSITTLVAPNNIGSSAGGGNIKVSTSPTATVSLQNSTISASVADGPGGGGNISIDPQFVILQNSSILAHVDQGTGGSITIIAGLFLQDGNSVVNADSGSGRNGTVTIQSPNAPISGQIQPLGGTPLPATSLLNQRCASLAGGEFSSFTMAGRDSLPTEPGSWLSSPLTLGPARFSGGTLTETGTYTSLSEPDGETPLLSLRQIAPPGFLTQAFAVEWSAGCTS